MNFSSWINFKVVRSIFKEVLVRIAMVSGKEVEKGLKKRLKVPPTNSKLTPTEKEILHLISDEFLTIKQVAQRRQTSIQAVYKILNILKRKGAYNGGLKQVEKIEPTINQRDIRLHGQEFNIKIIWQDNKYQELLEKSNILFIDSNTIRLYKNSIEIYSGQSFYGKSADESEKVSLEYWNRFFTRLEHSLRVILIKPRSRNIRIVNQHYARGDSELCDNARKQGERIWIHAEEDGKLCFITDDSFGFREDEAVHPKTSKPDRKAIDKQVNDWRLRDPPTNSQLSRNLNQLMEISTKDMSKREEYSGDIVEHKNSIILLSKGIKKLTKVMGGVLEENRRMKRELKNQSSLGEWI